MLHHEPVRPWWVPGVVNQHCPPNPSFPITEIPGDSFVFAEKNHGREQPVSAWQSNVPGSQDTCMLGILAWNYSSRQQRVFSGECHSELAAPGTWMWAAKYPSCPAHCPNAVGFGLGQVWYQCIMLWLNFRSLCTGWRSESESYSEQQCQGQWFFET